MSSETHEGETKVSDNFINDIRDAVEVFVTMLSKIAKHHKWYIGF